MDLEVIKAGSGAWWELIDRAATEFGKPLYLLEAAAGIGQGTLYRYDRRKGCPKPYTIARVAVAVGWSKARLQAEMARVVERWLDGLGEVVPEVDNRPFVRPTGRRRSRERRADRPDGSNGAGRA